MKNERRAILLTGVIGHPIAHSLSPEIFEFLKMHARPKRKPFIYFKLDVAPRALKVFLKNVRQQTDWAGVNVTLPHKQRILRLVDQVQPEAQRLGAANVITVSKGKLLAHNTDVKGLGICFKNEKIPVRSQSILILGAGGAARATLAALSIAGAQTVYLWARKPAQAHKLALDCKREFKKTKIHVIREITKTPADTQLVINATPLGMGRTTNRLFPTHLRRGGIAIDLIYRPLETSFLRAAKSHGFKTVNGLSMLVGQALATWEIWFGPLSSKPRLQIRLVAHLTQILKGSKK